MRSAMCQFCGNSIPYQDIVEHVTITHGPNGAQPASIMGNRPQWLENVVKDVERANQLSQACGVPVHIMCVVCKSSHLAGDYVAHVSQRHGFPSQTANDYTRQQPPTPGSRIASFLMEREVIFQATRQYDEEESYYSAEVLDWNEVGVLLRITDDPRGAYPREFIPWRSIARISLVSKLPGHKPQEQEREG